MNRSGRPVAAASRVIEIEEVFDARMACGGQIRSELAEELLLDFLVLDDRLDDRVGLPESVEVGGRRQPAEGRGFVLRAALALGHLAIEILVDRGPGLLEQRLRDVDEDHRATRSGRDMGDAPAHLSPADHTQGADFHDADSIATTASRQARSGDE